MTTVEVGSTERGFALIEFEDRYEQRCTLQGSSLATEAAIWFGVEGSVRMHLSQKNVREVLPALQRFAETGELLA